LQKAWVQAGAMAYVLKDTRPSSVKFWLFQQRCPTQAIHYDGTREFLQEMYIQDKVFRSNAQRNDSNRMETPQPISKVPGLKGQVDLSFVIDYGGFAQGHVQHNDVSIDNTIRH
jgi:hypothetical protein